MTESLQLTVDGREERPRAPVAALTFEAPPLFNAPATVRGQLALPDPDREEVDATDR
jgi:hypothetical protein